MREPASPDLAVSASDDLKISVDPADFAHWPESLHDEMLANKRNGCVGSVLVSETDRVRVWHLIPEPGKRYPFHVHVNPHF